MLWSFGAYGKNIFMGRQRQEMDNKLKEHEGKQQLQKQNFRKSLNDCLESF